MKPIQFINKFIVLLTLMAALCFIKCAESAKSFDKSKQNLYKKTILGTWEDDNSIVTYFENNTFDGSFGNNKMRFQGYYEVAGDTLKMNFPSHQHFPEYIIEKMDSQIFEIRSLDDGSIFVKNKIKHIQ